METYYTNFDLARENRRIAEERAQKETLIRLATGNTSRSKMLVKLAGVLINVGTRLKMYAERDFQNSLQFPTLQDL